MPLSLTDVEGWVEYDYRRWGFDPRRPPGGAALWAAARGRKVRRASGRAALRPANDGPEIALPWKLADAKFNEHCCHEVGEWRAKKLGYREVDVERVANQFGACYAVPRRAFQRAWAKFGCDLPRLAAYFLVTQGLVALRVGEVTGLSCALVTPREVHRRGLVEILPDDETLRAFTRSALHPGLKLVQLSDVRRRWLVLYTG